MSSRQTEAFYILQVFLFFQSKKCKFYKGQLHQLETVLSKKNLKDKLDTEKASQQIKNLIMDGVLIVDNKKSGEVRLANVSEIKTYQNDFYCFECFSPGELIKCRSCTRAFHMACARRHPERPKYVMPKSNAIAQFDDDDEEDTLHSTAPPENFGLKRCRVVVERSLLIPTKNTRISESNNIDQNLTEEKPEVVCLGELRPPTRQRYITENSSLKCESDVDESVNFEKEFCTFCRLLKSGKTLQPPNLDAVELCHLLNYTFKRNRAWIKHDIYKRFEDMKLKKSSIELLVKNLFPNRGIISLDAIKKKIQFNKYNLLNELLADIIEFQYVLGVLFGKNSLEYDGSKFLFRDIQYDIQEIRRCPDCYRHSNDRITPFWFALPCVQRHELVFAKCTGHAYWPAKVVRVLRKANKYDVRFFGGNHERSVVDKNYIRAIDAMDIKKPNSAPFKRAMNELHCYQALEAYSLDKFSFHSASNNDIHDTLKTVMEAIDMEAVNGKFISEKIMKRRKTIATSEPAKKSGNISRLSTFIYEENLSNFDSSNSEPRTPTPKKRGPNQAALPTKRLKRDETHDASCSVCENCENQKQQIKLLEQQRENEKQQNKLLEQQRENEKQQNKLLEQQLIIAKRKSYCFICLKPAEFICCINASYCSKKCQRQHWIDDHKNVCSHRNN